jgi:two-component system chemotaxis response regulator CheB
MTPTVRRPKHSAAEKNIKVVGGLTLAQDRLTSVVYGMPRAALEQGAVTRVLPLGELAGEIELALRT